MSSNWNIFVTCRCMWFSFLSIWHLVHPRSPNPHICGPALLYFTSWTPVQVTLGVCCKGCLEHWISVNINLPDWAPPNHINVLFKRIHIQTSTFFFQSAVRNKVLVFAPQVFFFFSWAFYWKFAYLVSQCLKTCSPVLTMIPSVSPSVTFLPLIIIRI